MTPHPRGVQVFDYNSDLEGVPNGFGSPVGGGAGCHNFIPLVDLTPNVTSAATPGQLSPVRVPLAWLGAVAAGVVGVVALLA